jgi:hypothetical protein
MFNTVTSSIDPNVPEETSSLFAAFSDSSFNDAESRELDTSSTVNSLKASLTGAQREALMLAKAFGVTSVHKVAGSAAGRSAYTAMCRLREKKIEPPDELKRALTAGAHATGIPEIDSQLDVTEPVFH